MVRRCGLVAVGATTYDRRDGTSRRSRRYRQGVDRSDDRLLATARLTRSVTTPSRVDLVDLDSITYALKRRRDELCAELARLTKPPEAGVNVSFGKRVGDGTTEAVERISTTATARVLARSVGDIELALERIEQGAYGICSDCGDEIPAERLSALPAVVVCVACRADQTARQRR